MSSSSASKPGGKPIALTSQQARNALTPDLRNTLYGALVSTNGFSNIETAFKHELQASGWHANLRAYMTQLLRSGECTTYEEVEARVRQKLGLTSVPGGQQQTNGASANGTTTNGVNGHGKDKDKDKDAAAGASAADDDFDLHIPERAIREMTKVTRQEINKVVDITVELPEDK